MSLFRTKKQENPFVQIDKHFLNDDNLTWGAKGILAYILSKPDSWKIRKEDLIKRSGDGKSKVEAALLNLLENGYLHWYQLVNDDGSFGEWVYDVYERPEFNPDLEACRELGKKRIEAKKTKNKERNNKPKVDNQISISPKVDNPLSDNPLSDNQLYSNNDFSNNDFSNNELKKEEEEDNHRLNELVSFFSKNITATATEVIKNKIDSWMKVLPFEVIKAELENCALHGAKSWKYVEKALLENQGLNITTIEQLEQKHAKHQTKRKETKTPSKGQSKPRRREKLPEWFDKEEEVSEPGGAQKEDIEAKKKELLAKLAKYKEDMEQNTIN